MSHPLRPQATHPSAPALHGWQHPAELAAAPEPPRATPPAEVELPEPVHNYRTGRILARLTSGMGAMLAIASLALVPVAVVSPRTLSALPLLRSLEPSAALALVGLASGLGLVMLGQVVRAILDHANAARELVAIERARATPATNSASRPRRRRG